MASETSKTTDQVESKKDFGKGPESSQKRWMAEIKAYEKTFDEWESRCSKIVKKYRSEKITSDVSKNFHQGKLNLLWSNIQTMQPAIYSRMPEPDVTRKHKDKDPSARAAAIILQRTSSIEIEDGGLDRALEGARDDYLLCGRGQVWVRYVPTYGDPVRDMIPLQHVEDRFVDADGNAYEDVAFENGQPFGQGEPYEPVVHECVKIEFVNWADWGHTPAPAWEHVRAVWRRVLLTRDQLIERFGKEKGKQVDLTKTVVGVGEEMAKSFGDVFMRAEVYEIWDKTSKKVLWVSPGYPFGVLDEVDDPLGLEDFFPCPRPIYGTLTSDSLVPVPDYISYQTQADEIDKLTERVRVLTKVIRVAGAYNGEFDELGRLLEGGDNTLIPINTWAAFSEAGGVDGAMSFLPIKEAADVLSILVNAREQLKQDLYEVTGISDIVRGQSDPRETAKAQQIKGQYAGIRLSKRQKDMAIFIRDVVCIVSEIVAELFSDETILMQSGWMDTQEAAVLRRLSTQNPGVPGPDRVFMEAVQIIRDDRMRGFRVNIETDQIVVEDDERKKQERVEFITASTQLLEKAVPASQQFPAIGPLLSELLMFGIRGFKAGREIEANFEEAIQLMGSQQTPPEQEGQQETETDRMVAQSGAHADMIRAESTKMQAEIKQLKTQMDQANAQRKIDLDAQRLELEKMRMLLDAEKDRAEKEIRQLELALRQAEIVANAESAERERDVKREQISATVDSRNASEES